MVMRKALSSWPIKEARAYAISRCYHVNDSVDQSLTRDVEEGRRVRSASVNFCVISKESNDCIFTILRCGGQIGKLGASRDVNEERGNESSRQAHRAYWRGGTLL